MFAERFVQAFDLLVTSRESKTRETPLTRRDVYDLIVDFQAVTLDESGYVVHPIEHAKLRAWLKETVDGKEAVTLGANPTPVLLAIWFHAQIKRMIPQTFAVHVKKVASLEPCGSYSL
jgi:hypothetical protein